MRYIGIDLAWAEKGSTGLAVLDEDGRLLANSLAISLDEIAAFILRNAGESCLVGIDAPLIVKNAGGHRPCEIELARRGIPAYPANRELLTRIHGSVRGEILAERLAAEGFVVTDAHPVELGEGRFVYEIYPWSILDYHSYDPETRTSLIPPYKKKPGVKVADIRRGIREVRDLLGHLELPVVFDHSELVYPVGDSDIDGYRGQKLKAVADLFDAILSAYAVYSVRLFGYAGGEVVGDLESGYILVPPNIRGLGGTNA
ncbi:MAG: DUF429 domain-containing protein [Chloroflexi bacterium]|nr:DUF429 domain-containing protein [Chloroflexota bacterium]